MRVLTFGWEFPPHNSGGLGVACQGLSEALADAGVQQVFVLPKQIPTAETDFPIVFADITEVDPKTRRTNHTAYASGNATNETESGRKRTDSSPESDSTLLAEVNEYGKKATSIAQTHSYDLIHAHDWLSYKAGIAAKEVSNVPLVVHVHATEYDRTAGRTGNDAVEAIEKRGMERADRVITVSGYTRSVVLKEYDIDPSKVDVVHNGIETQSPPNLSPALQELKDAGNAIVLFLGRKTIQKGPDYFLKAAERILQQRDDIYFVMAGSGDMEEQLIRQAAEMGIAKHVLFADFLRGDDVDRMYQSADVYVLPSVSEPFGITPLESLMNGTPTVISNQSGVSEILENTLSVDFWDIDDMANKIVAAAMYDGLNNALAKNGKKELQKITWERAAQKCKRTYASVV